MVHQPYLEMDRHMHWLNRGDDTQFQRIVCTNDSLSTQFLEVDMDPRKIQISPTEVRRIVAKPQKASDSRRLNGHTIPIFSLTLLAYGDQPFTILRAFWSFHKIADLLKKKNLAHGGWPNCYITCSTPSAIPYYQDRLH